MPPSSGLKGKLNQKQVEAGGNPKVHTVQVGFSPVSICLLIQHKLLDLFYINVTTMTWDIVAYYPVNATNNSLVLLI
jgi:hypothetical protein